MIIAKYKDIELSLRAMGPRYANFIRMVAIRPDGRERVLAEWFPNLITDFGLNAMGTYGIQQQVQYCLVGTGITTPAVTDTAMDSHVASASAVSGSLTGAALGVDPYYNYQVQRYRFAVGAAAGNLSEVGFSRTSTNDALFSRARIKDGGGSPTTITVLSDEILDVYYEVRRYPELTDTPYSMDIAGVTYSGVIRASEVTSGPASTGHAAMCGVPRLLYANTGGSTTPSTYLYSGAIGTVTQRPSGTGGGSSYVQYSTYSNNSLYTDNTATFGLDNGNVGGANSIYVPTSAGAFQMSVSPVIPKDNTKILTLNIRVGQWGRYTP